MATIYCLQIQHRKVTFWAKKSLKITGAPGIDGEIFKIDKFEGYPDLLAHSEVTHPPILYCRVGVGRQTWMKMT